MILTTPGVPKIIVDQKIMSEGVPEVISMDIIDHKKQIEKWSKILSSRNVIGSRDVKN